MVVLVRPAALDEEDIVDNGDCLSPSAHGLSSIRARELFTHLGSGEYARENSRTSARTARHRDRKVCMCTGICVHTVSSRIRIVRRSRS